LKNGQIKFCFNFYVDLVDLKIILADFRTLADIWRLLLDTERYIFIGNSALEFYNI